MSDRHEIIGRYVEVRGTRAYYESCGEGIPLVFIHSAGTDSRLYRHQLQALAEQGFQVVAPDLPGHGKSFPINWEPINRLRVFSDWVIEFIRETGLERPVVAGCSIGGDITIDLVAHYSPELRAGIAMEGAAHTPTFTNADVLMDPHAMSWESIADSMAPTVIRPDATPDQLKEIVWLHKSTTQRVYASDLVGWEHHDVRDKLGDISVPLLVVLGTGDYFLPDEIVTATTDAVESAELLRLENLGHYPMWEDPETVNAAIIEFLERTGVTAA